MFPPHAGRTPANPRRVPLGSSALAPSGSSALASASAARTAATVRSGAGREGPLPPAHTAYQPNVPDSTCNYTMRYPDYGTLVTDREAPLGGLATPSRLGF